MYDVTRRIARRWLSSRMADIQEQALSLEELKDLEKKSALLMSKSIRVQLRRVFTQRGDAFFEFYLMLRRVQLGESPPVGDLLQEYRSIVRQMVRVKSPVDGKKISPQVMNRVIESIPEVGKYLRILSSQGGLGPMQWRRLAEAYAPLIELVARDKGVYLEARPVGSFRWSRFTKMRDAQAKVEMLRDVDPVSYDAVMTHRTAKKVLDERIRNAIESQGLVYETSFALGQPMHVGVNADTGERLVFTMDGMVMSEDQYRESLVKDRQAQAVMTREENLSRRDVSLLRTCSDEEVDNSPGPSRWVSLTDDKAKQSKHTRIFRVKQVADPNNEWMTREVISEGRYKGIALDDMVNSQGRLLEGSNYVFDPSKGEKGRPVRVDPALRDPYVTVTNEEPPRLCIRVEGNPRDQVLMKNLRAIAGIEVNPSGQWYQYQTKVVVPPPGFEVAQLSRKKSPDGSFYKQDCFYFTPDNFAVVRDAIGGMLLSEGASKFLGGYFDDLARAEQATKRENLAAYSPENLGGFKSIIKSPGRDPVPMRLLTKQKEALAWLEANGDKGVVALDTGIGKTLSAIAMMQKLIRDGWTEDDSGTNGRFLFVVPVAALKGNIHAEIRKFLEEENAEDLVNRVDCMTVRQYSAALGSNKAKVKFKIRGEWKLVNRDPWNPEEYVAVFFDEAHQYLTNPDSTPCRRTLAFNHPRKICLTASPVQKEPMDAYVLAAVCNNTNIGDTKSPAGKKARTDMRAFKRRFCEEVGGRILGVKQDVVVQRDLRTWVKTNIFYAEKTDVSEYDLPGLSTRTESLVMDPGVEEKYKEAAAKIRKTLEALTVKFRDKGYVQEVDTTGGKKFRKFVPSFDTEIEKFGGSALRPVFKLLTQLSLSPEKVVDGLSIADNPKVGRSREIIAERIDRGAKTILFTDSAELVPEVAQELSRTLPGIHVAARGSQIQFFRNGEELKEWTARDENGTFTHKLPFSEKKYKLFDDRPAHPVRNPNWKRDEWSQFVLRAVVQGHIDQFTSMVLHGKSYQSGQNLQLFDTVIHLDRNSWNSENMKQRTARAWRQGQKNPVEEITLDVRYSDPKNDNDTTLDEVRKFHQMLESDLFDRIIKDAQTASLGTEWLEIEKRMSSYLKLDEQTFRLMLSPYLDNTGE